ncbi:hypothetical protein [Quadrisphaera sp. KR29]|uniref:hypothetical protein n=1 Tax=Quadrisphaera sp. KR29 TaxID=3461391 RepID=UPI004043F367
MSEHAHVTADQARTALSGADAARRGLAARGRWLAAYFAVFAAGSAAVVALIGLGGGLGTSLALAGWLVLVVAGVVWATSRPVRLRGEGWLHGLAWGVWGVVYGLVLVLGRPHAGEAAYWVPAALVSTLPLLAAALVVLRRSRR